MCCRDFETKERESEGREVVLGMLLKLLVKDELLHSGNAPVNAELRPLKRERKFSGYDLMCTIIHPCGILLLAQARPKMPCIYTSIPS